MILDENGLSSVMSGSSSDVPLVDVARESNELSISDKFLDSSSDV